MNVIKHKAKKRRLFLEALAAGASVSGAARRAVLNNMTVYRWRKEDPQFARDWDEAIEIGTDRLEDEALRRAVEGVEEPVYHNGQIVGFVRKYSDTMLIFTLKARRPHKYRDRTAVEHSLGTSMDKDTGWVDEILKQIEDIVRSGTRPQLQDQRPSPESNNDPSSPAFSEFSGSVQARED